MSKRTNEFQKLVFLIQKQLAGNAQVTESKLIKENNSNQEREIDIVTETKVGGISFTIGIECIGRKRPLDVEVIDKIYGKHADLPIHKTVIVSKSGFTTNAIEKAGLKNIETLTLKEAKDSNWLKKLQYLEKLQLNTYKIDIKDYTINCAGKKPVDSSNEMGPDSLIFIDNQDEPVTLDSYLKISLTSEKVLIKMFDFWSNLPDSDRENEFELKIEISTPDKFIKGASGIIYRLLSLNVKTKAKIFSSPLKTAPKVLFNSNIAYGATKTKFPDQDKLNQKALLLITEQDKEENKYSLHIEFPKDETKKIIELKEIKKSSD